MDLGDYETERMWAERVYETLENLEFEYRVSRRIVDQAIAWSEGHADKSAVVQAVMDYRKAVADHEALRLSTAEWLKKVGFRKTAEAEKAANLEHNVSAIEREKGHGDSERVPPSAR